MTEDRFHELLNLHLDHEATPAESAELEAELRRDPARRRRYRDYCRMQRACAQIFEHGCAAAPASFALEKSLREADAPEPSSARRHLFPPAAAFAGLGALAACAVFVLMRQAPPSAVAPAAAVATSASNPRLSPKPSFSVAASSVPSAGPAALTAAGALSRPSVSLTSHAPSRVDAGSLNTGWDDTSAAGSVPPDVAALMADFALPPVQPVIVDDLVVEPRPVFRPAATTLQAPRDPAPAAQLISFQFKR
jgi:hypothetical protein